MKNKLFLFCFFVFSTVFSQNISGVIQDEFGLPIENVHVLNSKSNTHIHTGEFGNFEILNTFIGDVLQVSAFGFKKTTHKVLAKKVIIILEADSYKLDEVIIEPKLNVMNIVSKMDLQTAPVNSSQEILRKVPGLFIGQHAGGGKAEQLFLRGFDIDHGTDIAISVDGMPVNMVSHAHGQGYADLHFLIPETIEKIDFGKGTYYANKGDFATAGYVSFLTKNKVNSSISTEFGQFNSFKTVGVFNLLEKQKQENAYIATEFLQTDGYFDASQNLKKTNLFGKYTNFFDDNSNISIIASHFSSQWDASGQVPQRLIDAGSISRFGAIDDTEGGKTSRSNLIFSTRKIMNINNFVKATVFYTKYDFELYSNFTFFLNDPVNGDQIRQKESRSVFGSNIEWLNKQPSSNFQFGFGFRNDATQNTELSHTLQRFSTLETQKLGDINQTNFSSYLNLEFDFGNLKINPAFRIDYFKFEYQDKLASLFKTESENQVKFSPKLNFMFSKNHNLQLFLKTGFGFHSNDTRLVVAKTAGISLPTAFGADFGFVFKPAPKLLINSAVWILNLDQELVYVGDAAVVQLLGKTKRYGIDFGLRYQLNDFLFLDADLNYTHARKEDLPQGQNFIPRAPDFTATGGLSLTKFKKLSGGFHFRYLKSRPANEDNSVVAIGYFVNDLNLNYDFEKIIFGISVENVFNVDWNETQFATESRLKNEIQSVNELHLTPGTPFFLKAKMVYQF